MFDCHSLFDFLCPPAAKDRTVSIAPTPRQRPASLRPLHSISDGVDPLTGDRQLNIVYIIRCGSGSLFALAPLSFWPLLSPSVETPHTVVRGGRRELPLVV